MKLRRTVSCMMALLLVCSLPVSALADTYDLAQGSVTVNASESGQTVTHGTNDAVSDDAPVIIQSNNETPTTNTVTIKAEENATANVTIQNVNIVKNDPNGTFTGSNAAVTIDVADGASANVNLSGVNIDTKNTGGQSATDPTGNEMETYGEAAVQTKGNGNVTLELDGENTVQGGQNRAGVEKNSGGNLTITDANETNGSLNATGGKYGSGIGGGTRSTGSNITITGSAEVTATGGWHGSGIGGGRASRGSDITISGSAKVTATGSGGGSGIGGGFGGDGSNITVSQDAQVKAQGGEAWSTAGAGAAIGNGGRYGSTNGAEVSPNTAALTPNGKIEYYAPGADMKTDAPYKTVIGTYAPPQPTEPVQPSQSAEAPSQTAALYRVIDQDGKALACKTARKDGVLTITVDADFASLTGTLGGIQTLKAQGVDTIVFVTKGASSGFALSGLLAQGNFGDAYKLTHDGETVTFTLNNGADAGTILQ